MIRILVIIIAALFIGVLIFQIDDELDPGAALWLEKINSPETSEAYFFLMGFFSKDGEDPVEVGKSIYKSIKEGEDRYINEKELFDYIDYPKENKIALPKGDIYCPAWQSGCLKLIFENVAELKSELSKHSTLLERYSIFIRKDGYKTLTRPMLTEPIPPYEYFTASHRLNSIKAIVKAHSGEPKAAVSDLYTNFEILRGALYRQDNIIGKLIVLMMLSENLDIMSILMHEYDLDGFDEIGKITKEERDFENLMARELGMMHDTYRNLDRSPEFWEMKGNFPGWLVRILFKPNMSINVAYPGYHDVAKTSQLSQVAFATYVQERQAKQVSFESEKSIRNYIGSILSDIARPDFTGYLGRFFDINCKIELLNSFLASESQKSEWSTAVNPYGSADTPSVHENGSKLCFQGPLEDIRNLRCLVIKI